jgi:hypothetical protein
MRGLIRLFLAALVVSGAVMTASPAHAAPGHPATVEVVAENRGGGRPDL